MIQSPALLFLPILSGIAVCIFAIQKRNMQGARNLLTLAVCSILWAAFLLTELRQNGGFRDSSSEDVSGLFAGLSAIQLYLIAVIYSRKSGRISRFTLTLLYLHPLLSFINLIAGIQHSSTATSVFRWIARLAPAFERWSEITSLFAYSLELIAVILLLDVFWQSNSPLYYRLALWAAIFAPIGLHLSTVFSSTLDYSTSASLFGFSVAGIGVAAGIFRSRPTELSAFSRDGAVEQMDDGWMMVDTKNKIIDINPAAERMIGVSRPEVFGRPVTSILAEWPNFIDSQEKIREFEMRKSFKKQNEWSYISTRILQARDRQGNFSGHLILWKDVTGRRLSDRARQQAREEMFVLLGAISSAANRAMSHAEFLSEIDQQLLQAFQSQAIALFLVQSRDPRTNTGPNITLESHFGFSEPARAELCDSKVLTNLKELSSDTKQAVRINSLQYHDYLPPAVWETGISQAAVIPLLAPSLDAPEFLGYVLVARKDPRGYGQDEMVRMSIAAEHIAMLIHGDRRRQTSIALTERQKLLRDLHDSVSQRLYGLVATAEAAQAAIEAGSTVDPAKILAKVGENARQAVKEMRLFLYEMQPVDLEKEGLVSVLHYRLAAVEGRADLKAQLIADENLLIPKEKEVTLYYIAQEALNNILRHAHANSILIKIWKSKKNLILQITDNGVGFTPSAVARGGMGLNNIKERTSQIDGKLKILSKPGAGTKITVTVPLTG